MGLKCPYRRSLDRGSFSSTQSTTQGLRVLTKFNHLVCFFSSFHYFFLFQAFLHEVGKAEVKQFRIFS